MPVDIDFSPLGDLYNTYRQGQQRAARERVLGQLGQGSGALDYGTAARALLAAGDTEGGLSLARLAQQQQIQSPEHAGAIAEAQAKVSEKYAPKTTNIKTPAGDEITVEKGPGGYRIPTIEGQPSAPNNPFAQGKMNATQSKDALYASRLLQAEKVLQEPDVTAAALNVVQHGLGKIPVAGNFMVSTAFQKYDQAQRNFINAALRPESGAVISEAEFENAKKQYFPQPGDSQQRIEQKRQNRHDAIRGIAAGAGPGYKPELIIGEGGNVVENPSAKSKPQTQTAEPWRTKENVTAARANPQAVLQEARAAIAKNPANRETVIQRLRQVGIDPAGL